MHADIIDYNNLQSPAEKAICEILSREIESCLADAENKIWHRHPSGSLMEIQLPGTVN